MSLHNERKNSLLDPETISKIWFGNDVKVAAWKKAVQLVERDFILNPNLDIYQLTLREQRNLSLKQISRIIEIKRLLKNDPELLHAFDHCIPLVDHGMAMRFGVHDILFRVNIREQGNDEQVKKWDSLAEDWSIIGCFAMTELGTSSFLRGTETTATYDPVNQEFIINSPTITATKWWIGLAGETATHTVALCQLVIEEKQKGLHWFVVPLRDLESRRVLPGVSVGDVGPKASRNAVDNGWIQFTNVRIPRENMLMRWAQVEPNGNFIPAVTPAISYATLVGERVTIFDSVFDHVGPALAITSRFSCVRKQGATPCIMDFQAHYVSLLPPIAVCFAMRFRSRKLRNDYDENRKFLINGDTGRFLLGLNELHALASGLKCWSGWFVSNTLEECRRCLGGYSYSSYSGIPSLINDWGVFTQGGGPNVVVAQQHARWLLNNYQNIDNVPNTLDFFRNKDKILAESRLVANNVEEIFSHETLIHTFQWLTIRLLENVKQQFLENASDEDKWNSNMTFLLDISKVHIYYDLFLSFYHELSENTISNEKTRQVLNDACSLTGVWHLRDVVHLLLETEFITAKQSLLLRKAVISLSRKLREDVVPLIDGLLYADFQLKSAFGCYDGNVYERYLQQVKRKGVEDPIVGPDAIYSAKL